MSDQEPTWQELGISKEEWIAFKQWEEENEEQVEIEKKVADVKFKRLNEMYITVRANNEENIQRGERNTAELMDGMQSIMGRMFAMYEKETDRNRHMKDMLMGELHRSIDEAAHQGQGISVGIMGINIAGVGGNVASVERMKRIEGQVQELSRDQERDQEQFRECQGRFDEIMCRQKERRDRGR